jgi:HK97 family phage prohead protease
MPAQISALGEDEVLVTISTDRVARDGHVFEPGGMQLDNYRANPVVLWQHLTDLPPVGRSEEIETAATSIKARVRFAPAGISPKADEIRGLVKAGFINAVSVGIDPIETEPLDPKKPRAGQRVMLSELLELSFCNVPIDTGAVVTARAQRSDDWKVGASRSLPVEDSDDWDGSAAESSVFEWAGGDDFDPSKARKGFLAYNASKPKERGSYKLPIAHAVDGRLKVPKGAIRAAASRLPQADIPDDVKKSAQAVLDHYKEQAGMSDGKNSDSDRSLKAKHTRTLERASRPYLKRGLYEVASLAYMLEQLGYAHACSEWEAAVEGDDSQVPEMIGEALVALGEAFVAMSKEEVQELLAGNDLEIEDVDDDVEIVVEERAFVAAGKTPRARAWRRGIALARAGKTLSATNAKKLDEASGHCDRAMKHQKALGEHNQAVGDQLDGCRALNEKAAKSNDQVGEALAAAKDEPANALEHVARALRAQKAVGGQLNDMAEAHTNAVDRCQDVGDAHNGIGRSVKSAQRCMRAVVDGSATGGEDSDSKDVQASGGDDDDDAGDRSKTDFRRRQAELRALSATLN